MNARAALRFSDPPATRPIGVITVPDQGWTTAEVVRHAWLSHQLDGSEPFACSTIIEHPLTIADALPDDAVVMRTSQTDFDVTAYARTSSGSLHLISRRGQLEVRASAATQHAAQEIIDGIRGRAPEQPAGDTVKVHTFRYREPRMPQDVTRDVDAPVWAIIRANYPDPADAAVSQLMAMTSPPSLGRLILWHGPPGTGKTTAVRALMRAWDSWCTPLYITDPEQLFRYPEYLEYVLTAPLARSESPTLSSAGAAARRWRLIIAEDTDEYLRASPRREAGAALGRLLNLTDGILGQAHDVLVLLTTNEDLGRIHPAITRPGRCLARVQFPPFSVADANTWLPTQCPRPNRPVTLAELLEIRGDLQRVGPTSPTVEQAGGQYL